MSDKSPGKHAQILAPLDLSKLTGRERFLLIQMIEKAVKNSYITSYEFWLETYSLLGDILAAEKAAYA